MISAQFSRVCIPEYFRNHRHTYRKYKYYILFRTQTATMIECVLLRRRAGVSKAEIRLPYCSLFFFPPLLFSIRFIPPRRKLFYLRSSFHREQSWLIANAIITLKTARHVGTESRKYAKLVRDSGKKIQAVCFAEWHSRYSMYMQAC